MKKKLLSLALALAMALSLCTMTAVADTTATYTVTFKFLKVDATENTSTYTDVQANSAVDPPEIEKTFEIGNMAYAFTQWDTEGFKSVNNDLTVTAQYNIVDYSTFNSTVEAMNELDLTESAKDDVQGIFVSANEGKFTDEQSAVDGYTASLNTIYGTDESYNHYTVIFAYQDDSGNYAEKRYDNKLKDTPIQAPETPNWFDEDANMSMYASGWDENPAKTVDQACGDEFAKTYTMDYEELANYDPLDGAINSTESLDFTPEAKAAVENIKSAAEAGKPTDDLAVVNEYYNQVNEIINEEASYNHYKVTFAYKYNEEDSYISKDGKETVLKIANDTITADYFTSADPDYYDGDYFVEFDKWDIAKDRTVDTDESQNVFNALYKARVFVPAEGYADFETLKTEINAFIETNESILSDETKTAFAEKIAACYKTDNPDNKFGISEQETFTAKVSALDKYYKAVKAGDNGAAGSLFDKIFDLIRFKKTVDSVKTFSIFTLIFRFIESIFKSIFG